MIGIKFDNLKLSSGMKNRLEIRILRSIKPAWSCLPLFTTRKHQAYELIPVPYTEYGVFYTGDCYVIINREGKHATLHFWFGKYYTEDFPACVSDLGEFDRNLEENKHIEVQDDECEMFLNYFKGYRPAIQYLKGRYGDHKPGARFFRLDKVAKEYRLREIDLKTSLMTKDGSFIMDTNCMTYAYISDRVGSEDRLVTIDLAHHIRSVQHNSGGVDIADLKTSCTENK